MVIFLIEIIIMSSDHIFTSKPTGRSADIDDLDDTEPQSYISQHKKNLNLITIIKRKKGFSQGSCSRTRTQTAYTEEQKKNLVLRQDLRNYMYRKRKNKNESLLGSVGKTNSL